MRSLPDLQAAAIGLGLPDEGSREELMDRIRDHLGHADELQIDPMKAKDLKKDIAWGTDDPFAGIRRYFAPNYVMEPKLDGARMRLFIGAGKNRMNTGRRSDVTYAYIERSDNFRHLRDWDLTNLAGTILDGEILAPKDSICTSSGVVTKGLLNSSVALVNTNPDDSWACQMREGLARFVVFDILAFKGVDVTIKPYKERRAALEGIFLDEELDPPLCLYNDQYRETVQLIDKFESSEEQLRMILEDGYEGAMIKNVDGAYQAGKRSGYWLKVKRMSTIDVVIDGWDPGEGRNLNKVGALRCVVFDDLGIPVEVAQPGSFTDEFRDALTDPATGGLREEWRGKVIEVMAQEITKNGKLRHPQFVRVRPDKSPEECGTGQLAEIFDVRM